MAGGLAVKSYKTRDMPGTAKAASAIFSTTWKIIKLNKFILTKKNSSNQNGNRKQEELIIFKLFKLFFKLFFKINLLKIKILNIQIQVQVEESV